MNRSQEAGDPTGSRADEGRISLGPADGPVQVRIGEVVLADSDRATLLEETGCPPRWYLPQEDVRLDLLRRTTTTTVCPFKGRATYWSYEDPVTAMAAIRGLVCFYAERTTTTVDGRQR